MSVSARAPTAVAKEAPLKTPHMVEVRCRGCGHLLFKADAVGKIETVCPDRRCRRMQTLTLPCPNRHHDNES